MGVGWNGLESGLLFVGVVFVFMWEGVIIWNVGFEIQWCFVCGCGGVFVLFCLVRDCFFGIWIVGGG